MSDEIVIGENELQALPEYSCSIPTGTVVGKRWRCRVPYVSDNPDWRIYEYYDIGSDTEIGIRWAWAVKAPGEPHRGNL